MIKLSGSKKRDVTYPRTPADIDRKYQARLKKLEDTVERLEKKVEQLEADKSS